MKMRDLTGKRFDRLLVIKLHGSKYGRRVWDCRCDCGKEIERVAQTLRRGKHHSCGCVRECYINFRRPGTALRNSFYSYKKSAKSRGHRFDLTFEQFSVLVHEDCFYCGIEPSTLKRSSWETVKINGIDRLENSTGYIIDNCVSCCPTCNYMKRSLSQEDFFGHIRKIVAAIERRTFIGSPRPASAKAN